MLKPICSPLLTIDGLSHGFFTRQGGVSEGIFDSLNVSSRKGDNPDHVTENLSRIASHYGLSLGHLNKCHQVHGIEVLEIDAPISVDHPPRGDALVTSTPDLILGITTADCCPILLADMDAGVIGAVHAGWKGALNGVIEATLDVMERRGAKSIMAVLGPCIQQKSYEVDSVFFQMFIDKSAASKVFFKPGNGPGYYWFDLPSFCVSRLKESVTAYDLVRRDTCAENDMFFSNRRAFLKNESAFGLQLSTIVLR